MNLKIIPTYYRNTIIAEEMGKTNTPFFTNEKVLSFNSYINSLKEDKNLSTLSLGYLVKQELIKNIDHYPTFGHMFKYPKFIFDTTKFLLNLNDNNCSFEDVKLDNKMENELLDILKDANEIVKKSYTRPSFNETDLKSTTYYHLFYTSYFEYQLINSLSKQGLKIEEYKKRNDQKYYFYYGDNFRQEIEGIAQKIVEEQNADTTLLVCTDYSKQYPIIKSIFFRYNIPVTFINEKKNNNLLNLFIAYLNLFNEPTLLNLDSLISNSCIRKNINNTEYKCISNNMINIDDFLNHSFNNETLANIQSLLSKTNFEKVNEALSNIKPFVVTDNDVSIFNTIKNKIVEVYHVDQSFNDITLLINNLESVNPLDTPSDYKGVIVTSLSKPFFNFENEYIVGATQNNYPGFKPLDGIYDEAFAKKIGYIPLDERVQLYNNEIEWIKHAGKKIYFSFYKNNYEGKAQECSFEVEQLFKGTNPDKWPLIENDAFVKYSKHKLNKDISQKLFIKDNILKGSVSSFEQYNNCHYAYFLSRGLKIDEQNTDFLPPNFIGSVQHEVMETLLNKFPNNYFDITEKDLREIIVPKFKDKFDEFPTRTNLINGCITRMVNGLLLSFEFLKDFENTTSFKVKDKGTEVKFDTDYLKDNDITIRLRGSIDRLNVYNNMFMIMDYKSSSKSLSEKKVLEGLQLQLLTYTLITMKLFPELIPVGSYYYSLKNDSSDTVGINHNGSNHTTAEYDENNEMTLFYNSHRLKGWTYNLDKDLDDSTHIVNLKIKNGTLSTKEFDIKKIEEAINAILIDIKNNIMEGNIALEPNKDACKFCVYKPICHFSGLTINAKQVIDINLGKE